MAAERRRLVGTPISQPTRACYWALLIAEIPFHLQEVNPLAGETRTPEFLALNPAGTIPVLVERPDFALHESGAILLYLVQKFPESRLAREFAPAQGDLEGWARVNEYLHWHHHNTRNLTLSIFRPKLRETLGLIPKRDAADLQRSAKLRDQILTAMTNRIKRNGGVSIASPHGLTIADIQAYCEVDQLEELNDIDWAPYPELKAWADRMKTLPKYTESHQALVRFAAQAIQKASL